MAKTEAEKAASARYREKNREKLRAAGREYQRLRRLDPEYAELCRERSRTMPRDLKSQLARESYVRHAEKRRAEAAAYRAENRDKVLAYLKDYYSRTRDERIAYAREYRLANIEACRARTLDWQGRNRARKRTYDASYRARKNGAEGSYSANQFAWLCRLLGDNCFYCDRKEPLTADHAIPLSRGGTNWIDNIVPACRGCNSSKCDKTLTEYLDWRRERWQRAA